VHVEVVGEDAEALQSFYRDAFDWQMLPSGPGYAMAHPGVEGGINGGVGASLEGGQGHVTFYVEVGDLEATLGKIEGLGGSGVVEPMDVPDGPRSRCSPTPRAILWASSRPDLDAAEPRGEPCKRPNNVDNETPLPEYAEK